MIRVYLAEEDISRFYLLPITPPEITVKDERELRTYSTVYHGDLNFIRPRGATEISFESFLPGVSTPFSYNNSKLGVDAVAEIMSYYRRDDPIRLLISGGGINLRGTIKSFHYWAGKGNRFDYRLIFVEKMGE